MANCGNALRVDGSDPLGAAARMHNMNTRINMENRKTWVDFLVTTEISPTPMSFGDIASGAACFSVFQAELLMLLKSRS